jgi:hypothetical protein
MPETFQSLNEPAKTGMPQFAQTSPVVGGGLADAAVNMAGIGANIFQQMSVQKLKDDKANAQTQEDTIVGGVERGLLDIRRAASSDSSVDATSESRRLLAESYAKYPHLATKFTKAYKDMTGMNPSGLDDREEAKLKLELEAADNGFKGQVELYTQFKRQDIISANKISSVKAQVDAGKLSEDELRRTVLGETKSISDMYSTKVAEDMTSLVQRYQSGDMTMAEAKLAVTMAKTDLNRKLSSFGKFIDDPKVRAYMLPMQDSIQLAESIVSGTREVKDIDDAVARNEARRRAVFMADPEVLDLVVTSKAFNYTTGIDSRITNKVLSYLPVVKKKTGNGNKPTDFTGLSTEEKKAVLEVSYNMFNGPKATPESKAEAIAKASSVVDYLGRNGDDTEPEDRKLVLNLLSQKGLVAAMDQKQKNILSNTFTTYMSDDVDRAVRENITNAVVKLGDYQYTPGGGFSGKYPAVGTYGNMVGADTTPKPIRELADLTVADGTILWKAKPEFRGEPRLQYALSKLNTSIEDNMVQAIQVQADGLGISFEKSASVFIPELGDGGDKSEGKKQATDSTPVGNTPAGKVGATELKDVIGQRESGGDYEVTNQLGYLGKYQFGGMALEDLGYKAGSSWTGKDNINSKEDFLASPDVQEKAADKWFTLLESRLRNSGAYKYVGTEVGGVKVTEEGLVAAAHLVGAKGVLDMLKSGKVPEDANGTKATEYLGLVGGK